MVEPAPSLRQLQRAFFDELTSLRPLSGAGYDRWIVADSDEQARARLEIYKGMYAARLREVLRHDYPAVAAVLGQERFSRLALEYLDAYPSRRPSVRHLGRRLSVFLTGHESSRRRPWLAQLARLEWARGEMVDAPDSAPATAADLAAVPAERWPGLRFGLVPAHRLLRFDYPVHRVWLAVQRGEAPPETLAPSPMHLVTWRQGITVKHEPLSPDEAQLLGWLEDRLRLEQVGARLALKDPGRDNGQLLASALHRWVAAGLLRLVGRRGSDATSTTDKPTDKPTDKSTDQPNNP